MSKTKLDMCEGPFLKKIVLYTVPIILTGLLQLTFNAADLIIVGQFCGSTSVAAVGATGSLTNLFVNFFIGLSVGSGVSVAQAIGANDPRRTEQTVHTALPLAFSCGIFLTVIGLLFSGEMLKLMGTPENELPLSTLYMRIYFCGSAPSLIYNFGASILRASGDTKSPLVFLTAGGILNVALNTVFVTVFGMNVDGVALATVLSQVLSATLVTVSLIRRTDACKFNFRKIRFHAGPLKKILRIGIPSGIQSSLFSISNVLIQSTVNSFGSVMLAGNSAATSLGGFVYTSMNGVYQTAMNFTGQNLGARKFDNVKRITWIFLGVVTAVGVTVGLLMNLFAKPLLGIYITDSPESIAYGIIRLRYMVLPYFICGMMDVTTGILRGMGSSLTPMAISVLGACGLRILWIYTIFPLNPTPEFLYISYPISWIITLAAQYTAYRIVLRRKERQIEARMAKNT